MPERIFHFTPENAEGAARLFAACSRLRSEGARIRVGVLESSFGPARGLALPPPSASLGDLESLGASDEALVIVSHAAMSRVEEISRPDYLAVVGGGVRFGAFSDEVGRAGLRFAHEPDEAMRETTIAGLIMAGTRFPTDERFGDLREQVLSLELAIPKGEVIRTGSRAVKDVAGYNIAGFVMGGGGRCGMIARATLRLLPMAFGGAAAGGTPAPSVAGRPIEGPPALAERVYDVFDPSRIMLP